MTTQDSLARVTIVLACALALAGCRSPATAPVPTSTRSRIADSPQRVLTRITEEAQARGWRIADMGPDTVLVDCGVAAARVDVADDVSGATSTPRETEIHCTALFVVTAAPGGAQVTVFDNPVYWHPDARVWLPGPSGAAPGRDLLLASRGVSRPAAAR
jgi:hypothetical protein